MKIFFLYPLPIIWSIFFFFCILVIFKLYKNIYKHYNSKFKQNKKKKKKETNGFWPAGKRDLDA